VPAQIPEVTNPYVLAQILTTDEVKKLKEAADAGVFPEG
jgi:hypothetical protein